MFVLRLFNFNCKKIIIIQCESCLISAVKTKQSKTKYKHKHLCSSTLLNGMNASHNYSNSTSSESESELLSSCLRRVSKTKERINIVDSVRRSVLVCVAKLNRTNKGLSVLPLFFVKMVPNNLLIAFNTLIHLRSHTQLRARAHIENRILRVIFIRACSFAHHFRALLLFVVAGWLNRAISVCCSSQLHSVYLYVVIFTRFVRFPCFFVDFPQSIYRCVFIMHWNAKWIVSDQNNIGLKYLYYLLRCLLISSIILKLEPIFFLKNSTIQCCIMNIRDNNRNTNYCFSIR